MYNAQSIREASGINLSRQVTLLVGPNNSGKSTVLRALSWIQNNMFGPQSIRLGSQRMVVSYELSQLSKANLSGSFHSQFERFLEEPCFTRYLHANGPSDVFWKSEETSTCPLELGAAEPYNHVFNLFSVRSRGLSSQGVSLASAIQLDDTYSNIASIVDVLSDREHPSHTIFCEFCKELCGVPIGSFMVESGKAVGLTTGHLQGIPLDQMGSGIRHLVIFAARLSVCKGKLFLIEEIENDLHPTALRILLRLIKESSAHNQFVISTHSAIVLTELGALEGTKILKTSMELQNRIPTTTITELEPTPENRFNVLTELGYDPTEFSQYRGWLFLEESSAQSLFEELARIFAPRLVGELKLVSCNGVANVKKRFESFGNMILFLHLENRQQDWAWVVCDGCEKGTTVVGQLRESFPTWSSDRFQALRQAKIEDSYPQRFREDVEAAFATEDKDRRKESKRRLTLRVLDWIRNNQREAKAEFAESAAEIVDLLRNIERTIFDMPTQSASAEDDRRTSFEMK